MSFGDASDWQDTWGEPELDENGEETGQLANMPLAANNDEWPGNLISFLDLVLTDTILKGVDDGESFVWQSALGKGAIEASPNTAGIVQGWSAYVGTATCTVPSGTKLGEQTLSGPGVGAVLPTSVTLGAAKLAGLADAAPTADPQKSEFPKLLHEATSEIQFAITGADASGNAIAATLGIE